MAEEILVTGGLGYIGSHAVVSLVEAGFTPIIIDNLSNTSRDVLDRLEVIFKKKITFYEFDILDTEQLKATLSKHNIFSVIHFAAYKAVGESVQKPMKYYENNVVGLLSLLKAMDNQNINHLVFSSSCTVYGEPDVLPVTETSPIKEPASPYGATKQIGEQILKDAKPRVIALRYFNPIGAHESATIGEMPLGVPNNLVPFITQSAIGKRGALTVNGGDYPTTDGTNIRDYIHVMDLADAHVAAIKRQLKEPLDFEIFNIGTGKGNSVLEVINTFERENNIKLNYKIGDRRDGDVVMVYGDVTKANKVLGWKHQRSLADSVTSAWAWEQFAAKLNEE
jgi:UDP-glucose 4-epimerase